MTPANASAESVANSLSDVQHSSLTFAASAIGTSFGALAGLSSTQLSRPPPPSFSFDAHAAGNSGASYIRSSRPPLLPSPSQTMQYHRGGGGAVVVEVRMCIAYQRDKEEDQGDEEGVMAMDMVKGGEEDLVDEDKLEEEEVQDEELEDEEEDVVDQVHILHLW